MGKNNNNNRVMIIILNYLSYELTMDLITQLKDQTYDKYDIVVIDNNSPNASGEILRDNSKKYGYYFIQSNKNNGYASGNNIGIRYAVNNGYQYSLVINNDVKLTDDNLINKLVSIMDDNPRLCAIGPQIFNLDGEVCAPYCRRPTFFSLSFGIINEKKYRKQNSSISQIVYRVHGCCMLLDNDAMSKVNYMDERTFLYSEEDILAEKMMSIGKTMYYCADTNIVHMESNSIKMTNKKKNIMLKNTIKSMDIYLKDYRHFGLIKRRLCEATRAIVIIFSA